MDTLSYKTISANKATVNKEWVVVDAENMILGRWKSYIKSGNGGNIELKKLSLDYIRNNFKYSILDIFKSTIDDQTILDRESWWKVVLQTREFGYNKN